MSFEVSAEFFNADWQRPLKVDVSHPLLAKLQDGEGSDYRKGGVEGGGGFRLHIDDL